MDKGEVHDASLAQVTNAALNEHVGVGLAGAEFKANIVGSNVGLVEGRDSKSKVFRGIYEQSRFSVPLYGAFGFSSKHSAVPDVSVIIPAYREEKTITEVLQRVSEVSGSLGNVEIIVVDDGSTDRTGAKIAAYDPVAIPVAKTIFKDTIHYASSTITCLKNAECAIIITEWPEFKKLQPEDFIKNMKHPALVDGRRIYNAGDFLKKMKFAAIGLGSS